MRSTFLAFVCGVLLVLASGNLPAAALLSNGDFNAGLTDWTTTNSGITSDSAVVFVLTSLGGPTDPIATNGSSGGPASRVLYQDFVVPIAGVTTASFSFDFFSTNPNPLDSATVNNVQGSGVGSPNIFRIDIVDPTEPVFTTPYLFALFVDEGGIVGTPTGLVAQTFGDPVTLAAFLNANAGNTLRLRIGVAESTFPWSTGVDNVSLMADAVTPIPEPTTMGLFGLGAAGLVFARFRSSRRSVKT